MFPFSHFVRLVLSSVYLNFNRMIRNSLLRGNPIIVLLRFDLHAVQPMIRPNI